MEKGPLSVPGNTDHRCRSLFLGIDDDSGGVNAVRTILLNDNLPQRVLSHAGNRGHPQSELGKVDPDIRYNATGRERYRIDDLKSSALRQSSEIDRPADHVGRGK